MELEFPRRNSCNFNCEYCVLRDEATIEGRAEVLSDADKRARYDRFGHTNGTEDFPFGGAATSTINDIFGDIFGEMFGGGPRRTRARTRGSDLRYHLEIGFEEAVFGTTARISIPRSACAARSARKAIRSSIGAAPSTCSDGPSGSSSGTSRWICRSRASRAGRSGRWPSLARSSCVPSS